MAEDRVIDERQMKTMSKKYVALIPAYKPSADLLGLLEELYNLGFQIVIVNDGSGVEYEKLLFECSRYAEILHHNQNEGKGNALKTGLRYIYKTFRADCIVVTVDADGQHRAEDALAVAKTAEQTPNALVLGSRKLKGKVPLRSHFGNTITRLVFHLSTKLKVYDTQTGLRAFDGHHIPKLIIISGSRYEYEMNVLLRFAKDKIPIIEKEIQTIYLDNNASSHFDAVKDSARIYKEIIKFSASSFVSFLVDYTLYSILLLFGCKLTLSNVIARIISASVNFTLNRKLVFKSNEKVLFSALKYALLAISILLGNTIVLNLLVHICGLHQMLAKLITEIIFFIASWFFQRLVVFKRRS